MNKRNFLEKYLAVIFYNKKPTKFREKTKVTYCYKF